MSDNGFTTDCIVTFKEVLKAIDKLNSGKGDVSDSLKRVILETLVPSFQFTFLYFCQE